MKSTYKGQISIFLSFVFIIIFSLIMALLQSATLQLSKNYKRGDMELAMNSVFAEYHTGMLESFHVFTLDGSYEGAKYHIDNVLSRLEYYGASSIDMEVSQIQLLTDNEGALFKEQVMRHMRHKYGLDYVNEHLGQSVEWKKQEVQGGMLDALETESLSELEASSAKEEVDLDVAENPLAGLEQAKGKGILNLVVKDKDKLSTAVVELSNAPSKRQLRTGMGGRVHQGGEMSDKLLYSEYLMDEFRCMTEEGESGSLVYELEYLLAGTGSDSENLKKVANQLVMMRLAPNYFCLNSSPSKQAALSSLALSIATASAAPFLEPVVKKALEFAWVYAESIMDVRSLLSGNRVTLTKKDSDWQLGIQGLFTLGQEGDNNTGKDMEGGIKYKEYLRMLLFLEKEDVLVMRTLDLVESRIREVYKQPNFQVDACINHLRTENVARLEGGIFYRFPMYFTYR